MTILKANTSFKQYLLENRVITPQEPYNNLVVIMGLPGAGKSTVLKKGLLNVNNIVHVTPDKWIELTAKTLKKDLTNPLHTQEIYNNIRDKHNKFARKSIDPSARSNFVLETLSRNPFKIQGLMIKSKEKGMRIIVVYVRTSLTIALENNKKRKRVIPEEVIIDTFKCIDDNFKILRSTHVVDEAWIIDNTSKPSFNDFRTSQYIERVK